MKKVLVTGGAGFIGAALSTQLVERYEQVVALDSMIAQVHPTGEAAYGFDERVRLVKGDVTQESVWDDLLSSFTPELVIHLAAETGTGQSLTHSALHTHTNIVGTATMLDAFARHGAVPERIVITSSRAVYGEGQWEYTDGPNQGTRFSPGLRSRAMFEAGQWDFPNAAPVPMQAGVTPRKPSSVYGVTKVAEEDLVRMWADAFGTRVVIIRPQNVYGIGQTPANPYTGIISTFCQIARSGKAIPLYEDGLVRRDYVEISDIARAILLALEAEHLPDEALDIGSGTYTTLHEAASIIADIFHAPAPVVTGQWRHGDIRHAWADVSQAEHYLGFRAQVGVREGFERLAAWIESLDEDHSRPRYES